MGAFDDGDSAKDDTIHSIDLDKLTIDGINRGYLEALPGNRMKRQRLASLTLKMLN